MKLIYKISLLIIVLGFIVVEFLLRAIWGFGTMPLYVESNQYEYISVPNQDLNRYRNIFILILIHNAPMKLMLIEK